MNTTTIDHDQGVQIEGQATGLDAEQLDAPSANGGGAGAHSARRHDLIMKIPVTVQIVIGKTKMSVADLVKLGPGSVITLDRHIGDPVDLIVNGHLVARGQLVIVDEENSQFGISLTEVVDSPTVS
ncbi:MAG: flagellar motor switch protein FliN [Hyphomicrobiaceae bacterium]